MSEALTVAEYRALSKRNKYRAKPQKSTAGIRFGSKREKERYGELLWLEAAGHIGQLEVHPRFRLDVNGHHIGFYTGDFGYQSPEGYVLEDVKSAGTRKIRDWVLRKRLMLAIHGIEIREV